MKRLGYAYFFGLLLLALSCEEKDPQPSNISSVRVSELEFVLPESNPGAKKMATVDWIHSLPSAFTLTFESEMDGQRYSLLLDPNRPEAAAPLELPFGSYLLSGQTLHSDISDFLPFSINESIQISQPSTSLSLKAQTDYGLFTLSENQVRSAATVVETGTNLPAQQGYYYLYAPNGEPVHLAISPKNGTVTFRTPWIPEQLTQENLQLVYEENERPDEFQTPGFSFRNKPNPIDSEGFPSRLSTVPLASLPAGQSENSGLAFFGGRLFSINDGGNQAAIYELSPRTGEVLRTILIRNAANNDWEDLAQSDTHLFIGDFGNNTGSRKDLNILQIAWEDILSSEEVTAEKFGFNYADQVDFTPRESHDFDCEAFFFAGAKLHLFTKNRANLRTKLYTLDLESSNQTATKIGEFDAMGLITAADYDRSLQRVALLGYRLEGLASTAFVWYWDEFQTGMTPADMRRLEIGSPLELGQTEGLVFGSSDELLISAEGFSAGPVRVDQNIRTLDLTGLF